MAGQGSPLRTFVPTLLAPWSWLALVLCCAGIARGADLDVRLRLAWGGGEARSWQGTIRLSTGELSEPVPLGLEADTPGSLQIVDGTTLRVLPRMPRSYDGVDLRIRAPADAELIVELRTGGAAELEPIVLPVAKAARGFQQFDLDDRGNRLLAQRSPGDALRVRIDREHLVFAPSERLELEVLPAVFDLPPSAAHLLAVTLVAGRGGEEVFAEDHELTTDAAGQLAPLALAVPLTAVEGVFELKLALYAKKLTTPLVRGKPLVERKVQLVALDRTKPLASPAEWTAAYELDPANSRWWERVTKLPAWRRMPAIPTLATQELASGKFSTQKRLGRTWIELSPQGWQAFPLAIATPGQPHLLEVEYPSDVEATLGISLIEPNIAGQVGPIGLDSGVEIPAPAVGHEPQIRRHRLVFWPQTKDPYVLIVNRRPRGPALFGKISVLAGPAELAPVSLPPSNVPGRTLAAWYDKPLWPENFSASEALDPATGRNFDDWGTFYLAGRRLVETLQHGGYNAVFLNVACEGSAVYPSPRLGPNPRYDTGLFFESGQDPLRKDVLELVLRLCDRAGIQVIPSLQFAAPLPELEALRLAGGPESLGIEPIGPDGRTWIARHGPRRGLGVYYNALDPRVQRALQGVVAELAERYGQHPSFGGVAIQWTADSYAILPDETCSYDDATIARFESEAGVSIPAGENPLAARAAYLRGPGQKAWLAWRSQQLAAMYGRMQAEMARARPSAKLYLTPADLLGGRQVQQALRPVLPADEDPAGVLAQLGIDIPLLASREGIVVARPQRHAAGAPALAQALHRHWNQSPELDALFSTRGQAAGISFREPAPLRLPEFDKLSPFGPDKTHTWLVSQITPSGPACRQALVHSLATLDSPLLAEGGWLLPLGQEDSLVPLAKVFRRLPAERFATVAPQGDEAASGVVVRKLTRGDKTYFYAVNDTPWPVELELGLAGAAPLKVSPYAEHPARTETQGGRVAWIVTLEPFDLVGGELPSARATVSDYRATFPEAAADSLRERVREVRLRANALRSPPPKNVLANPSFETPAEGDVIPGWVQARGAGITADISATQGYESDRSLHLASVAPAGGGPAPVVWIRSDPFEAPTTGRLSVVAWMKVADASKQPKLRLAIEGKLDGRVYYRRANVGASEDGHPVKPLTTEWASYRFPLADLPLTGLTDLRVGFDLMSAGEVWIDDVQVFDLWFEESERDELLKNIAASDVQLSSGQLADCQRFLEGYWPSFLRQNVNFAEPRPAAASAGPLAVPATPAAPATAAKPAPPAAEPSTMEKLKGWWSKSLNKLR
ncbi:MAG: family 10 glycosylhydrolase [Pirellulaceae bacterium]|nr:family 10 glycosylhydrolase [Pirellulaceae bacterium]